MVFGAHGVSEGYLDYRGVIEMCGRVRFEEGICW